MTPPPVMWAIAAHIHRARELIHRAGVDAGGFQKRLGDRRPAELGRSRVEVDVGTCEQPPDQRVPVGMGPARGQCDHRVAGLDASTRDEFAPLRQRHAESRQIQIIGPHHVGMFRGLASEQCASGLTASIGDAFDQLCDGVWVNPAAGDHIQEERRTATARDHVVDAHCDQIDAEPVQSTGSDAQQHLCPDTVASSRDQGVAHARCVQAGETAVVCKYFARVRRGHRVSDSLDHRVGSFEAHPRLGVGERFGVGHRISTATGRASNRNFASRTSAGISVG